jgi:hypothetical protein
MNFGEALEKAKNGSKITRSGWSGGGMFIFFNPSSDITVSAGRPLAASFPIGTKIHCREYLMMKTANDEIVPWVASQSDLLCDDWSEV